MIAVEKIVCHTHRFQEKGHTTPGPGGDGVVGAHGEAPESVRRQRGRRKPQARAFTVISMEGTREAGKQVKDWPV